MSAWQPIETAPKDEYVIVFSPEASEFTRIMICVFAASDEPGDDGDWYELNADTRPIDVAVTHWQPLPPPPTP